MNRREEELMRRYIYQVIRRLPGGQRQEVGMELEELIGDMWEAEGSMEEVLLRLGNPREFAKKYQDTGRCLIGPEYYETYLWFLKIVLVCSVLPILAVGLAGALLDPSAAELSGGMVPGMVKVTADIVGNVCVGAVMAFAMTTLVFAVLERRQVKLEIQKEKEWKLEELGDNFTGFHWNVGSLSPIPHEKAVISRSDSIVNIVFIVIFSMLLLFAPELFAAFFPKGEELHSVPVFHLEQWHIVMPVIVLSLLIGLADEILRLVVGVYGKTVLISNLICSGLQLVLSVIFLRVLPIWNPDFSREIEAQLPQSMNGFVRFFMKMDGVQLSNLLLLVLILITLAEVGVTLYKTLRYGIQGEKVSG